MKRSVIIEQRVKSAFLSAVPDVGDELLRNLSERKGTKIEMNKEKKRHLGLKLAGAAAAAAVIAAASVTAAAFSGDGRAEELLGFTGREHAFGIAATYAVETAETEAEANNLANFILAGMAYDISSEDQSVTCGLMGLRAVYNVGFKVGGYSYEIRVDAKTGLVIDCKRTADPGWEEHIAEDNGPTASSELLSGYVPGTDTDSAEVGEIGFMKALVIAKDYFGIARCSGDGEETAGFEDYSGGAMNHVIQIRHGGYIYECLVNSVDGSCTELYSGIDPDFTGERHVHEDSGEYISGIDAAKIAEEATGGELTSLWFGERLGVFNCFVLCDDGIYVVYVDAKTGEVRQIGRTDASDNREHETITPKSDAPEGMISEADAVMAVLERIGADRGGADLIGISLSDGEYTVEIAKNGEVPKVYRVDAVTAEIRE